MRKYSSDGSWKDDHIPEQDPEEEGKAPTGMTMPHATQEKVQEKVNELIDDCVLSNA